MHVFKVAGGYMAMNIFIKSKILIRVLLLGTTYLRRLEADSAKTLKILRQI